MRFGMFEFPFNPAELKVAHRALLRESILPGGGEQVQRVGAYKRRVSGKGYFTGDAAMEDYLRLESLFGTVQTLFMPGRAPFEAVYGLIFGQIGQREQAAVEVVAVSIVFVQPVRRKLPIQIRSRFPGQRVETAAANQRAGRAHAGFPFRPLPVAFTILKSERNFGAMHRAFEEVARQGCAVHNTA